MLCISHITVRFLVVVHLCELRVVLRSVQVPRSLVIRKCANTLDPRRPDTTWPTEQHKLTFKICHTIDRFRHPLKAAIKHLRNISTTHRNWKSFWPSDFDDITYLTWVFDTTATGARVFIPCRASSRIETQHLLAFSKAELFPFGRRIYSIRSLEPIRKQSNRSTEEY
jgi:hypothetical protein